MASNEISRILNAEKHFANDRRLSSGEPENELKPHLTESNLQKNEHTTRLIASSHNLARVRDVWTKYDNLDLCGSFAKREVFFKS